MRQQPWHLTQKSRGAWARWAATFVAFPIAGVAARLAVGNISDAPAAALGGLVGGATLGALQASIGGIAPGQRARWTLGTSVGLAIGLCAGAATIGYRTDTASLVVLGAVSGAAVGLAQAFSTRIRAEDRLRWALATPLLWAGGWLVTANVIVDAERQHALFGSSGALLVSVLAGVLAKRWNGSATSNPSATSTPTASATPSSESATPSSKSACPVVGAA